MGSTEAESPRYLSSSGVSSRPRFFSNISAMRCSLSAGRAPCMLTSDESSRGKGCLSNDEMVLNPLKHSAADCKPKLKPSTSEHEIKGEAAHAPQPAGMGRRIINGGGMHLGGLERSDIQHP